MRRIVPRAQPPVVRGKPFVAEFRCHMLFSPSDETLGRMFRDGKGRVRVDYLKGDEEIRLIDDPTTLTLVFLDIKHRLLQREPYGEQLKGWSFRGASPRYTRDRKNVEGVECVRIELQSPGGKGETWISESQGVVMRDEDPFEGWVWEITSIEFCEPEEGVFQIPSEFGETEE
jgi:hypothetical protein